MAWLYCIEHIYCGSHWTHSGSAHDFPGVATLQSGDTLSELPAADLVAGCDGVNSARWRRKCWVDLQDGAPQL